MPQPPRRTGASLERLVRGRCLAALVLIPPALAGAQGTASPQPVPTPAVPLRGCQPATTGAGLKTRLPDSVLTHLEGMSDSPFVHAFLIDHVAQHGDSTYWLVQCARAFRGADISNLDSLQAKRVEFATIVRELRAASVAWAEEERRRSDTRTTLASVTRELLADPSPGKVEAAAPSIRYAYHQASCDSVRSGFCDILGAVLEHMDTILVLKARVGLTTQDAEKGERELARLLSVEAAVSAELADTGSAASLKAAMLDSLRNERVAARSMQDKATTRRDSLLGVSRAVSNDLGQSLSRLAAAFIGRNAPVSQLAIPPSQTQAAVRSVQPEVTSPVASSAPVALPAPSIALALADFVVDRAKQELFLAYLRDMYVQARKDTLLQVAFAETFALMRSLAPARADGDLSIVAAGRIPLSVWRATLTTDFTWLPLRLMQAEPRVVCRQHPGCADQLTRLKPVAVASQRLMSGDPVLDVLRDAPAIATVAWSRPTPELQRLLQGLIVVGGVFDAFAAQGMVPAADHGRHPYILSSRSLGQVSEGQQRVFLRLLLARAAPVRLAPHGVPDADSLMHALAAATRAAEQILALAQDAPASAGNASALFRRAGESVTVAGKVARQFGSRETRLAIDTTVATWTMLAGAVEPLIARNYGLAMSRTTMLVQHVAGRTSNRNFLTLVALGAGLAEATDGAQVRAAFEAAASPAGGWHAKRFREASRRSITAYPGAALGYEWMVGGGEGRSVGVAMPIGLDIQLFSSRDDTTGSPGCFVGLCSMSVFVPVVDLGALLSYRIDPDSTVASEPNTTFQQVFAPGAYASLGFGRSPFALLVGWQFMPSLRKVTDAEQQRPGHVSRFGVGLGVDVTLRSF